MHIADAFIRADVYECVLIAVGEKLSSVIPWHLIESNEKPMHHVSALTVGDAGGAVLVTRRESEAEESGRGILASKMLSEGALWEYCTLKGRGTLHPEDDSRDWLMCNARPLFNASLEYGPQLIREVLAAAHWDHADVDLIVPHQVSAEMLAALTAEFNRDTDFAVSTLPDVGNVAAANLPVTLEAARKDGRLKPNMKVFLGSGAAGFALGFAAVEW
jgi:3-oxoacyl-[acyl-carrier-protein] synthase-3